MNKFNKGKLIGVVAASLSAVSLMGVGFATWIITSEVSTTTDNITVGVADVQTNSIKITGASVVSGKSGLRFDGDSTKRAKSNGVISCGDTDTEKLSFQIQYTVTANNLAKGFKVKAYINDETTDTNSKNASGKFQTADETYKFITMPTILGFAKGTAKDALSFAANESAPTFSNTADKSDTIAKDDGATNSWNVTQTFTFGWGLAFNKDNPVALVKDTKIYNYNSKATDKMDSATTDLVKTLLAQAKEELNGLKFKVVLMPVIE